MLAFKFHVYIYKINRFIYYDSADHRVIVDIIEKEFPNADFNWASDSIHFKTSDELLIFALKYGEEFPIVKSDRNYDGSPIYDTNA